MGSSTSRPVYVERENPSTYPTSTSRSRRNSTYEEVIPKRSKSVASRSRQSEKPNTNTQLVRLRSKSRPRNSYNVVDREPIDTGEKPDTYIQANKKPGKHNTYAWVKEDTGKSNKRDNVLVVPGRREDQYAKGKTPRTKENRHRVRASMDETARPRHHSGYDRHYHSEDDARSSSTEEAGYAIRWGGEQKAASKRQNRHRRGDSESDEGIEVDVYPVTSRTHTARSRKGRSRDYGDIEEESSVRGQTKSRRNDDVHVPRPRALESDVPSRRRGSEWAEETGHRAERGSRKSDSARKTSAGAKESEEGIGNYMKQGNNYLRQGEGYIKTGEGLVRGVQGLFN